jgi:hypothetical protein
MLYAGAAMSASAEDPDLVYKVRFLQEVLFLLVCKDIVPIIILMNSFIFTASILLLVAAQKCKKGSADVLPPCIAKKIDSIKAEPRWNPPAEVHEYQYKGKRVFLFSADCCDQFNTVIDDQCNYICAPSGGITGKGDRKCTDFNAEAKYVKLVWKDPRD